MTTRNTAIIIGAGFGGLSLGIRLQSLGFDTTIVEKLDKPGGRAYAKHVNGFVFDMGPTVITVPHFIEELFALERDSDHLDAPDFPEGLLEPGAGRAGPATARYADIVPILPFYRIYFDDGTFFDYDGDPVSTRDQIKALAPEDLEGYERFHRDAEAIFRRGFLELGYTCFTDVSTMLRVVPDLLKLDAVRSLFSFTSRYFKNDKMRQVFSFETLLVGGNPLAVPAIYAMIHFVEKTWGVHYVMGGTGALVSGMARKYQELGGTIRYESPVEKINVEGGGFMKKARATGITIEGGEVLEADMVVSNADYAFTYMKLIDAKHRRWNPDWRIKSMKYSMSLLVVYFGFKKTDDLDLRHHNIILGPRYEELLTDIFDRKILAEDFSQYLHVPTLTDPTLAPEGHHAAYTLIPVPHNGSGIDWDVEGPRLTETVLRFLDEEGYIPGLMDNLVHQEFVTPNYFERTLSSHLGNGFGVEPRLTQSAFFRPHNRSEDIEGLYLVGASSQPGAGTPSVMMSAKMTARLVAEDFAAEISSWRNEAAAAK